MYTVYWPLTIGTVILLIVLFAPGGVLGVLEKRLRGARAGAATNGGEPEAGARGAQERP